MPSVITEIICQGPGRNGETRDVALDISKRIFGLIQQFVANPVKKVVSKIG